MDIQIRCEGTFGNCSREISYTLTRRWVYTVRTAQCERDDYERDVSCQHKEGLSNAPVSSTPNKRHLHLGQVRNLMCRIDIRHTSSSSW
jgi:hypothetical protein